jgi:GWxTD domain-containing protein
VKKVILLSFFFFFAFIAFASRPEVSFSYCTFDNPNGKPFVEFYFNTLARSIANVKKSDGKYQGSIQVQMIVRKDKEAVHTARYNLISPLSDKADPWFDFTDLHRVELENGSYNMQVRIFDNNSAGGEMYELSQDFFIDYPTDRISISDIELLHSYSDVVTDPRFKKNNLQMIPYASDFFPPTQKSLQFYAEIYRANTLFGKDSVFTIRYSIDGSESKKTAENFAGTFEAHAREVNVIMAEVPIVSLQSGNYYLLVEVLDKGGRVAATKRVYIQRANQVQVPLVINDLSLMKTEGTFVDAMTNIDTLKEFILSLYPISTRMELLTAENIVGGNDMKAMQQYILFFWMTRNRVDPESAWLAYKEMVDAVNISFKTYNKKGYETDRGRVYLQYGPPNERATSYDEPHSNPYEIWHYYKLNNQSNRKFVFMSGNRASNDFNLIHSDATGEINNPSWQRLIEDNTHNSGFNNTDEQVPDYYGKRVKDTFENPK